MKPGKPLERRKPLERGSGLSADPVKLQDWQRRSREKQRAADRELSQLPPDERPRPRRSRPPSKRLTVPAAVRQAALNSSCGVCVVCLHREGVDPHRVSGAALRRLVSVGTLRAAVQLHHVLPKGDGKWPHLAVEGDNLVGVCVTCHHDHEHGTRRMPRAALPGVALGLAAREGLTWYIERTYPQ